MQHIRLIGIAVLVTAAVGVVVPASRGAGGTTVLKATLTGRYLHTSSRGAGTAVVTITQTQVCWRFAYHGIDTPNVSGIHVAPPPAAGKHKTAVVPFTASTSTRHECESTSKWGASMPGWVAKVVADPSRFYVIVGTTKYPQGAIGGQLHAG